jgi:hypothetical protein
MSDTGPNEALKQHKLTLLELALVSHFCGLMCVCVMIEWFGWCLVEENWYEESLIWMKLLL